MDNSLSYKVWEENGQTFIDYTDKSPMTILSVGIKTGFGDSGTWAIQHSGMFILCLRKSVT